MLYFCIQFCANEDDCAHSQNIKTGKALLLCHGDGFAVRPEIAEAAAVPLSPDRQFGRADVFQPESFQELSRGGQERGLIGRRAVVLLLRSLLLHGKRDRWLLQLA
jgi:hypothetical protein